MTFVLLLILKAFLMTGFLLPVHILDEQSKCFWELYQSCCSHRSSGDLYYSFHWHNWKIYSCKLTLIFPLFSFLTLTDYGSDLTSSCSKIIPFWGCSILYRYIHAEGFPIICPAPQTRCGFVSWRLFWWGSHSL